MIFEQYFNDTCKQSLKKCVGIFFQSRALKNSAIFIVFFLENPSRAWQITRNNAARWRMGDSEIADGVDNIYSICSDAMMLVRVDYAPPVAWIVDREMPATPRTTTPRVPCSMQ